MNQNLQTYWVLFEQKFIFSTILKLKASFPANFSNLEDTALFQLLDRKQKKCVWRALIFFPRFHNIFPGFLLKITKIQDFFLVVLLFFKVF